MFRVKVITRKLDGASYENSEPTLAHSKVESKVLYPLFIIAGS
ncbi:hypothetical protein BmR1_04g07375 [Babesia microti strain RI]|uniref:Uncharacterized protein n=1 Tax=Babesia microti (strain RI) TaxID=1133968 RepID=I7ISJ3_BABMR|nr:hypothetical protein BmR1_04g07375 [Babesia microti strain RI]CCF75666.1 hypothetical protein BmR1_04g07375 [Babesia microti strain RI]|eukprot:XP_012650074.1 hypothetical protein BmR1_04g07375 [Babesia microti strain RI]